MTLAAGEQRSLARIEGALRRSDPKLAAMLSMFNCLTRSEAMPRQEFLPSPGPRRWPLGRPARTVRPFDPLRPAHLKRPMGAARFSQPERPVGFSQPERPPTPAYLMRLHRPTRRPVRVGGPAGLAGPVRLGRPGVPARMAAILPLVMAMCVLGLIAVLFSALSHVGSGSATRAPAASCHSVTLAGCPSAGHSPLK